MKQLIQLVLQWGAVLGSRLLILAQWAAGHIGLLIQSDQATRQVHLASGTARPPSDAQPGMLMAASWMPVVLQHFRANI